MTRTVYIVRHGNTFDKGDVVTRVGARTDLPLSRSGRIQVAKLASHLADLGLNFTRVLSSPLSRTLQTAEAVISAQDSGAGIELCEFLREIDYGIDENRPEAEVIARIGRNALDLWEQSAVVPEGWKLDTVRLIQAWRSCFKHIASSPKSGPALIVTSNGIARFALQLASQDGHAGHALKLATAAYGVLDISADGNVTVRDWNCRA